jgi:hypothetical protein
MDLDILSTKDQLEEFKESLIWKDITNELEMWKQGFVAEMLSLSDDAAANNPSTASILMHLGDLNGRIKAVDYLLTLPDLFLQILEYKPKEEEKGE